MGRMGPGVSIRAALILAASARWTASFAGEGIHGAGATFPAPLYAAWSAEYRRSSGVGVTFDAVGSGEGIERIRGRRVDFGASDAAPQELTASGLLQFPVVIGGVVPVVNIRGIKPGQLKLSGAVLADIYLGKITRWNDVSIATLNPTLALPNANITVVHRSDLSGSTLLWTDYLSRGKGNDGVASSVQRTRFAIGYVEDAFAAAAADGDGTAPMQQQLATDLPGTASWPITGASFILILRPTANRAKTIAVLRFFNWALHQGEPITRGLDYAPLPKAWVEQLRTLWATIRDSTGQPVWP